MRYWCPTGCGKKCTLFIWNNRHTTGKTIKNFKCETCGKAFSKKQLIKYRNNGQKDVTYILGES